MFRNNLLLVVFQNVLVQNMKVQALSLMKDNEFDKQCHY